MKNNMGRRGCLALLSIAVSYRSSNQWLHALVDMKKYVSSGLVELPCHCEYTLDGWRIYRWRLRNKEELAKRLLDPDY